MFAREKRYIFERIMLLVLFLLSAVLINLNFKFFGVIGKDFQEDYYNNYKPIRLKKSDYWDENDLTLIHIKNDNWTDTNFPWIQNRTGTWNDPHIIENVTINGSNSSWCIKIEDSNQNCIIRNCTLYNTGQDYGGIMLINSNNTRIYNNTCSYSTDGIYLEGSNNNTLSGNNVYDTLFGIVFENCNNNTIIRNNIYDMYWTGINLNNCSRNIISENILYASSNGGISLAESNNNTILGNVIYNSDSGMSFNFCNNNIIEGNTVYDTHLTGIEFRNCSKNIISENTLYTISQNGILLAESNNNLLLGNNVYDTSFGIVLEYSNNNIVEGNKIYDYSWKGILLAGSNNNTISRNNIYDNFAGILLDYSNYNTIEKNNIYNNEWDAISLRNCDMNIISENIIYNNSQCGIYLAESNNTEIIENSLNNNLGGVYLYQSYYNIIRNDTINYNDEYGVSLQESSYNNVTENILNGNVKGAIEEVDCDKNIIMDNIINDGKTSFPFVLILIILFIAISIVITTFVLRSIVQKRKVSHPKERKKMEAAIKEEIREEKEKQKREQKEKKELEKERVKYEKERQKVEERKVKIQQELQKRIDFVDRLIKGDKLDIALKILDEIQKEAETQELLEIVNEIEERIIFCKKSEVETINKIKQTILTLGAKFIRLPLVDIMERSGINDEPLIEKVIQDMINNKEIHGEYFLSSKALALEAGAPVQTGEIAKHNVFISYATLDTNYFQISKIVRRLQLYPEINEVLFWELDSKQNIVEFMEETLKKTNVFVLFCSKNSVKSKAVKDEWQAAFQMRKKDLLKIIPVYEVEEHVPRLLWQMLNVKFKKDDFEGFIRNLYEEIRR